MKKSNKENGTKQCTIPNVVHHVKITDFIGEKVWFDDAGAGYIWGEEKDGGCQMIGEVRGWGAIQNLFKNKDGSIDFKKAADFQDGVGAWIAEAINEKLEREKAIYQQLQNVVGSAITPERLDEIDKEIDKLLDDK